MTSYVTIPNADIDAESPIDVDLMTALRDNPIAITEGASGAPTIKRAAIDWANVYANEVGLVGHLWTNPMHASDVGTGGFASINAFYLYSPSDATTLYYRFQLNVNGATIYARLVGPATGGTTTCTTTDTWDSEIETIDISGASGWTAFTVQAYASTTSVDARVYQCAMYMV